MNRSLINAVRFWDRCAERYAKSPVANEALYRKKLEVTQQYLKADMHVLEFGCGTGSTATEHAPFVKQYEAIDISPKMIDICKRKLTDQTKVNLHFNCMAFESFLSDDCAYDVILAMSILQMVKEPEEIINKVFRLLKSGGIFVSSTTCIEETMAWFRFVAPIGYAIHLLPKVQVFSKQKLELMLVNAGFEIDYRLEVHDKKEAHFIVAIKP